MNKTTQAAQPARQRGIVLYSYSPDSEAGTRQYTAAVCKRTVAPQAGTQHWQDMNVTSVYVKWLKVILRHPLVCGLTRVASPAAVVVRTVRAVGSRRAAAPQCVLLSLLRCRHFQQVGAGGGPPLQRGDAVGGCDLRTDKLLDCSRWWVGAVHHRGCWQQVSSD